MRGREGAGRVAERERSQKRERPQDFYFLLLILCKYVTMEECESVMERGWIERSRGTDGGREREMEEEREMEG